MKEKKNLSEETVQDSGMISSSIFDNLFDNTLPEESNSFEDEAEKEDSLFSNETEETDSEEDSGEGSSNSGLTIADVFGSTPVEEKEDIPTEPEKAIETSNEEETLEKEETNSNSTLTIADVFGSTQEEEKEDIPTNIEEVESSEEEKNSDNSEETVSEEEKIGNSSEETQEEKESPISDIQQKLPPITITEGTEENDEIILKPISSFQEQLPPITIADNISTEETSNKEESIIKATPQTTIDPIFEKWKKVREEERERETSIVTPEPPVEESNKELDIQIGVAEETQMTEKNDLESADPFEGYNSTPKEETISQENNSSNPNEEIDYFNYNFEENMEEQISSSNQQSEGGLTFDFYNAIRPKENEQEKLPDEERIEFSKIFEKKENSGDSEQIITIDEEGGNEYRRKKQILKYSLYAFYVFLVIFAVGLVFFLIQRKSNFSLTRDEITLALRSTYQAEIIADTKVQENENFEWTSSDSKIATVNENGLITAKGKGSATITVKSKKSRKTKKLLVTAVDITINSIRFEKQNLTITEGDELTLSPIINDDKTIVMNLEWTSWNESVVTVDQNGHIIAVSPGETSISVVDPASNIGTEVTIMVKAKQVKKETNTNVKTNSNNNTPIAVGRISLDRANANMKVGETITVKATVSPSNASNKKVNWTSSNAKVATVQNGKISAVGEGKAIITATTQDGNKKASITVTVSKETPKNIAVKGVSLSITSLTLKEGETKTIAVQINPNNATNKTISWENKINNDSIIIVDHNNEYITIKGNKPGEATITVITNDGTYKATCNVTVEKKNTNPKPSNSNTNSNTNTNSNSNSNSNTNSNSNSNDNPDPDKPDPKPDPTPEEKPEEN